MAEVEVYGASDDLIEVEGTVPGCDEYNAEDASFVLIGDGGDVRLRIRYAEDGVWSVTVSQLAEDAAMLPVQVTADGYSTHAVIKDVRQVVRESNDG